MGVPEATVKTVPPPRPDATWRYGRLEDMDRSFDIDFWQAQTDEARLQAAWELVVDAWKLKGRDPDELRLQRSVVHYE